MEPQSISEERKLALQEAIKAAREAAAVIERIGWELRKEEGSTTDQMARILCGGTAIRSSAQFLAELFKVEADGEEENPIALVQHP